MFPHMSRQSRKKLSEVRITWAVHGSSAQSNLFIFNNFHPNALQHSNIIIWEHLVSKNDAPSGLKCVCLYDGKLLFFFLFLKHSLRVFVQKKNKKSIQLNKKKVEIPRKLFEYWFSTTILIT